jgi:glycosyltransferase involved in cell wall biosynthesis
MNITFVIFTYNEEKRIKRVIENFLGHGKILIADNKSTDRTQEIARSYGCDVFIREEQYAFAENQSLVNLLYEQVTTDWLYWGFADEMLEKGTLADLKAATESGKYDIMKMDRKNYFYGTFCNDVYHSYTFKAFKKHAIDFTDNVIHGMGKPTVPAERIYTMPDKYFIHHFISNTASSYLNVINGYTESERTFNYKPKVSIWYFLAVFIKYFLKELFYNKGGKSFPGIALTELMLVYVLVKNIKIYEQETQLDTPAIEAKNNIRRDEILKQLS